MTDSQRKTIRIGLACILAATVLYASVPVFLRYFAKYTAQGSEGPDAWTVNGIRYGVAAAFWLPFAFFGNKRMRRRGTLKPKRSVWVAALVPAGINIVMQTGWAHCPYHVEPAVVGFAIRSSFLFAIVLGFIFIPLERRLARSGLFWSGAAVCMVGLTVVLVIEALGPEQLVRSWQGPLLVMMTALFWAGYAVSVRRCVPDYPTWLSFGVICFYTAVGLEVLMLLYGDTSAIARLRGTEVLLMVASAFVGIVFSHVLLYRGIHNLGPVVANGTLMVTPFVTLTMSVAFLGEGMKLGQFLGGLLLVAGGVMLVWANSRIAARQAAMASPWSPPDVEGGA